MARQTIRTSAVRSRFLEVLAMHGNVSAAAAGAGVARDAIYNWRWADPDFAEAWDAALALGIAGLEDRALELAMAGNDRLIIFLLSSRKPEVFGQRSTVEVKGNVSLSLRNAPIEELRAELATLLATRTVTIDAVPDNVLSFPSRSDDDATD